MSNTEQEIPNQENTNSSVTTPDTGTPKEEVSYMYGFRAKLSNDKVGQAFVMTLSSQSNAEKHLKMKSSK